MRGILTRLPEPDADRVKDAARRLGVSQEQFCRRAILDALGSLDALDRSDLAGMVRAIYNEVCGPNGHGMDSPQEEAVAALVQLGMPKREARGKVAKVGPKPDVAQIIAAVYKENPT